MKRNQPVPDWFYEDRDSTRSRIIRYSLALLVIGGPLALFVWAIFTN